ncbi:MAG: hypothetical protein E6K99_00750 [Thaumarchaeota archaeon]|nr:MAG: hypothetical protein E6K99_00750 [Nitrososphaerota archaeon]
MSWCKVSSLSASVAKAFEGFPYPATKRRVLSRTRRIVVEGWKVGHFLKHALAKERYFGLREIMETLRVGLKGGGNGFSTGSPS